MNITTTTTMNSNSKEGEGQRQRIYTSTIQTSMRLHPEVDKDYLICDSISLLKMNQSQCLINALSIRRNHDGLSKLQKSINKIIPPQHCLLIALKVFKSAIVFPNKERIPTGLAYVIYKLQCEHCSICYISETRRHQNWRTHCRQTDSYRSKTK